MSLLLLFPSGGSSAPVITNPATTHFPGVTFEVGFGHTWREAPADITWTDITAYVHDTWTTGSGRSDELNAFDASTLSVTIDNKDRRFDPTHTTGPYYPNVKPTVPIRVVANWDGENYPLFYGFVKGWPQVSNVGDQIADVGIEASDALELFAQADYSGGVWTLDDPVLGRLDAGNVIGGDSDAAAGKTGDRVGLILDLVGWSDDMRDIDPGLSDVQAAPLDATPRTALQDTEAAEAGWLYQDPEGSIVFRQRTAERTRPEMSTSQVTFTDQDFTMPYAGLRFSYDKSYVYNEAHRERDGGVVQVARDESSIDSYFRRKHDLTGLPLANDADALGLAQMFVLRYAEPALRPEPLVVDPGNDVATQYPQVLGRQLLDRITIARTPQQVGDPITADYRIEGITHSVAGRRWTTTWNLSPVDTRTYWTLDDDALGLLDSGNLIGA